jgi:hypothetical protein
MDAAVRRFSGVALPCLLLKQHRNTRVACHWVFFNQRSKRRESLSATCIIEPMSEGYQQGLDQQSLAEACRTLAATDPVLSELLTENGTPPLWQRDASMRSLVYIVIEQKISLISAKAVMQSFLINCVRSGQRKLCWLFRLMPCILPG